MSTVTVLPRNIVVHARPTGLVASVVDEVELGFEQQRGKVDLPHVILLLLLVDSVYPATSATCCVTTRMEIIFH